MRKDWEVKKLGDICNALNGLWTGKKPPFIPVFVIRNTNFSKDCRLILNDVAIIEVEKNQYLSRKLIYGDIIIEKSGGSDKQPVGRPVIFKIEEGEYSFSNFTTALRIIDKSKIFPDFLYYQLKFFYFDGRTLKMQTKTTGLRNLQLNSYLKQKVSIPCFQIQQQIVEELDCLTSIIEKQKKQLEELDNLAQSIFYDMFGDPIENEKGWKKKSLGTLCEVSSAKRVLVKDVVSEGVPFIRGTELAILSKQCFFDKSIFSMFITPEHYEKVKAITGVPEINDLLIPSINPYGYVWKINTTEPIYFKDGRVIWIHTNHSIYNGDCLRHILVYEILEKYSKLSGAVFAELTLEFLRTLKIIVPPLSLQQQFAAKIEAIEKQKELIKKSIKETEDLFNSRMDYYFN